MTFEEANRDKNGAVPRTKMENFSQICVFLLKQIKSRKKYSLQSVVLLFVFIIIINLLCEVDCKCNETTCMNGGVCRNSTCVCTDGWQGSECQFCAGKVRYGI